MRILSIDFDYFVEENPDLCVHHDEDFYNKYGQFPKWSDYESRWRAMGSSIEKMLPFRGSIHDLTWNLRCLANDQNVHVAESHQDLIWYIEKAMNRPILLCEKKPTFDIVNIDAHHDIFYEASPELTKCDSTDWAGFLIVRKLVRSYLQVYPQWRERIPEEFETPKAWAIKRGTDCRSSHSVRSIRWKRCDLVFLCRSCAWTPPCYDHIFEELCIAMGATNFPKQRPS